MFQKIKKLPLLLILAILLAIGSSGFAFYQYKELQNFKDAGLFYDSNQKQVVLSPMQIYQGSGFTRFIGLNEIKDYLSNSMSCSGNLIYGGCYNAKISYSSSSSFSNFSLTPQMVAISENSAKNYNQIQNNQLTSAKYYGWFGSDKVEFNINTPVQNYKYNGDYYSNSEKKTYNFVGSTNSENYNGTNRTSIKLDEFTDGLLTGKIDLYSQDNTNRLSGLSNDATEKLNAENLYGTYTAKDQKRYDIFLTKNKETVDNWKIKEIKGKFYKGQNYGSPNSSTPVFIVSKDVNYFSFETWNFKDYVDGQEVIIKAKTREYTLDNYGNAIASYQPQFAECYGPGGCNPQPKLGLPQSFSTNSGIFNIESVEKI
jgi:hypothetical protein